VYQLKLVKTAQANAEEEDNDNGLNHGTRVLIELVRPVANTDRVVVADSYFASVQAACKVFRMGLRFIGTVKTATKQFPMNYFQRVMLPCGKGDHRSLLAKDQTTGVSLLSFVWADRDQRFFISTCLSTAPGKIINGRRWRQRDPTPNAKPKLELITINQTEAGQVYYEGCGKIDQHNRHRQDSLNLEKKVQTMDWSSRGCWTGVLPCHYGSTVHSILGNMQQQQVAIIFSKLTLQVSLMF
jgi:Transposase IS4